jgi:hypothetical protein
VLGVHLHISTLAVTDRFPVRDSLGDRSPPSTGRPRSLGRSAYETTPVGSPTVSSTDVANEPPRAHARIVYLGPVSPHWEVYGDYGERTVLEEFRARVLARLVLLPRDDPQFRRNRERIVRDAERERISIEWDLGIPESV